MKNLLLLLPLMAILMMVGCINDTCTDTQTFYQYDPVYYTKAQLRAPFVQGEVRELLDPGKMYFYNNYLFINERAEGVHVYDVSNLNDPRPVTFLPILGNFDIAIKDGYLYADNVADLVVLDVRDISDVHLVYRVEEYQESWYNESLGYFSHSRRSERQAVIDCSEQDFGNTTFWRGDILFDLEDGGATVDINTPAGSSGSGSGVSGSFARFTILNDFLYTVDQARLFAWDIEEVSRPSLTHVNNLGWGIETIFPYGQDLFIGSTSGMYIYSTAIPSQPQQLSRFEHAQACDPVVVQDDIAYVTLRNGTACQGFVNQLDIVDVSTLTRPRLIATHAMDNPHGLAVRGDVLYLGEGVHGLKSIDVSDAEDIDVLDHVKAHHAYDVISLTVDRLMVVGDDGFYIYDVSDPSAMREISSIPVIRQR